MTCRSLEDGIVELARGRDVGRGTAAAIEAHTEHCDACAAKLERERQVSRGLQVLAASTAGHAPSAMLERRLLEAFAAQAVPPARRWWMPAAAAALAGVSVLGWWQATRTAPVAPDRGVGIAIRPADPVKPEPPAASPAIASATSATSATGGTPTVAARERGRRRAPVRAGSGDAGFVALPAAAGLPDFESGIIVRMEMPSAALPAYGIEVVPDSKTPVEADLLIGQDGQARAIRLVTRASTRPGAEQ